MAVQWRGWRELAANWRQVSEMSRGQQDCPLCPLWTRWTLSGTRQAHHMHRRQTHDLEGFENASIVNSLTLVINF